MSRRRITPKPLRRQIAALAAEGLSIDEIVKETGCKHDQAVRYGVKRKARITQSQYEKVVQLLKKGTTILECVELTGVTRGIVWDIKSGAVIGGSKQEG